MTTLPNMGLALPVRGAPGSGVWHDALDAQAGIVDEHDHSSGKGKRINTDAISIDADLTLASYGITNIGKAAFAAVTALAAGSKTLFVSSSDNELYWRTNAGTNVKLTSGTSLNVSAFVGGIGGDYTAVSALVSFDDANDRYKFLQNAATGWARLASGEVRIYETGTSETFYVGLSAPAALAASYTIELPAAAPGSTAILQMSSTGVVTASNTISGAVTLSSTLGVTGAITASSTLAVTGALTASSTINATGLITAQAGVTCSAGQSVTVSGAGNLRHGTKSIARGLCLSSPCNVAAGGVNITAGQAGISLSNNSIVYFALPELPTHARIVNVNVYFNSTADRTACTLVLYSTSAADPATTTFTSTAITLTNTGTAISTATGANLTPTASRTYWVQISNGVDTPKIQAITVDYDVVA